MLREYRIVPAVTISQHFHNTINLKSLITASIRELSTSELRAEFAEREEEEKRSRTAYRSASRSTTLPLRYSSPVVGDLEEYPEWISSRSYSRERLR